MVVLGNMVHDVSYDDGGSDDENDDDDGDDIRDLKIGVYGRPLTANCKL